MGDDGTKVDDGAGGGVVAADSDLLRQPKKSSLQ
jgi:hypothetical protein